jgi:hypothetical protein
MSRTIPDIYPTKITVFGQGKLPPDGGKMKKSCEICGFFPYSPNQAIDRTN